MSNGVQFFLQKAPSHVRLCTHQAKPDIKNLCHSSDTLKEQAGAHTHACCFIVTGFYSGQIQSVKRFETLWLQYFLCEEFMKIVIASTF